MLKALTWVLGAGMVAWAFMPTLTAADIPLVPSQKISQGADVVPGEIIVTLHRHVQEGFRAFNAPHFDGIRTKERLTDDGQIVLLTTAAGSEAKVLQRLRQDSRVVAAQPNYIYRALLTPNDPSYPYQWNLAVIRAPDAWDFDATPPLYGGDPSVVVAILDTGAAYEDYGSFLKAPDFSGTAFTTGRDLVNNDDHPNDDNGHGSHVTATVAESANNGVAAAGLAFASTIMPIKVLDASGLGSTATIAQGIDFARQNGADVINLSLGGTSDDPVLHTAIQNATAAGVIVVAASGNDGANSVYYPARYDETIAVGATRYDGTLAPYSNYGTGIDLVAPGGDLSVDQNSDGQPDGIIQQIPSNSTCSGFANSFYECLYEGTSQATPHVSAAAALLLAAGMDSSRVRSLLEGSTRDLGESGYDTTYGWGLLDIARALSVGLNDVTPPTGSVTVDNGATLTKSTTVTLKLAATDTESTVVAMSFSNDGSTFSPWEAHDDTRIGWDLTTYGGSKTDGTKVVSARFRDAGGNISSTVTASILYDGTPPSAPVLTVHALLPNNAVILRSGVPTSVKTLVAEWPASTDGLSGIQGYQVALSPSETLDLSGQAVSSVQTYQSPTMTSGRTLYLHVSAVDGAGNSSVSVFTYVYQPLRTVTSTMTSGGVVTIVKPSNAIERRLQPFGRAYTAGLQAVSITLENGKPESLLVAPNKGRDVIVMNDAGKQLLKLRPYGSSAPPGMNVAAGDLDGDGDSELMVAPRRGKFPLLIFNGSGKLVGKFWPFGKNFSDGIAVAVGRLGKDGAMAIVTTKMTGSTHVRIFDTKGKRLQQFSAFSRRNTFGLSIAVGDVNGDGMDEIIVGLEDGPSQMKIFTAKGRLVKQFFAIGKKYRGGVRVANGDRDGDGQDEIIVTPARGAVQVYVFSGKGKLVTKYFAMPKTYTGGASVTSLR